MSKTIRPTITFLSTTQLKQAHCRGDLTLEDCKTLKRDDLVRYYNRKLQLHFRYAQWDDFFYTYHMAKDLDNGVNEASYVMAAHAYEVAYGNTSKSLAAAELIKATPGYSLCISLLQAYRELRVLGIAPLPPDWASIMNLCSVVTLGKAPPSSQLSRLLSSPRLPWHYELTPWKYSRSVIDRIDDSVFKQRRTS